MFKKLFNLVILIAAIGYATHFAAAASAQADKATAAVARIASNATAH